MPDIEIAGPDGKFSAYLAAPKSTPAPGLLVIQEIFGVNQVMRQLCDGFAKEGYFAICPDLFWRQQPGIQITDKTEAEWQQAFGLFQGFNQAKGVEDLLATLKHLRKLPGATGKAGSIGYCLGGRLAYLMATRSDADCNVGYYGVGIEELLGEASAILKPLTLHIAAEDKYCPPEAQQKIKAALSQNPNVTIHIYPGTDHAFARVGGQHYDAKAADLANGRTREFLSKNLKG
jgi:carboxymethylenebutenolidase